MTHDTDFEFEEERPSKSQRKRDMLALQKLGEELTQLKPEQLQSIPLDETLRQAIEEHGRIHHREGRRRHRQYIGKLMRSADHEAIRASIEQWREQSRWQIRQHHQAEQWRDRLLSEDDQALSAFIDEFAPSDIQRLRQLQRQAKKEQQEKKAPTSARKLFRLVHESIRAATP